ncbi:hypothetical protein M406DRAFT_85893, partial [Cryphonectria parasitica EP155]
MADPGPPVPIAIVGLSCRLPGGANSPEQLWELLERSGEAWSPVPADRFNEAAFYHPSGDDPNGTNNHRGGHFVDADLEEFDHAFFRLSPQQAAAMDPQQRMLLEMSYEALEDAGWTLELCAGSQIAVYAASFTADFERNLYRDPLNLPVYYLTGVEKAILSNRISHFFDLHGPSMTIDTACSGGLVAVHQACLSLYAGESDAAIVAAANLTMGPDQRIGMSTLHLTSGAGRCFPFDKRGDGYGRGEGGVVLVMKTLDKALRDRDPIRAVIRSTAVNQDGYTPASITYPSATAQEQLIREAYAKAGLSPLDVSYVEAHGTGTRAGDLEELAAIAKVFTSPDIERSTPLHVGSIKGNIGHTENTSGLAGLVKAILMLEHLQIPGTAGLRDLKAGLPTQKLVIPKKLVPWPQDPSSEREKVPRVSINSFGFGGTNAHAILERAPHQCATLAPSLPPKAIHRPFLFTLSANSRESLQSLLKSYHTWLGRPEEALLQDISYTLCCRRSALPWRFSCVASDHESFRDQIEAGLKAPEIQPARKAPVVVFVFTGQGAQWLGMARELLLQDTPSCTFRDSLRASRDMLLDLGADWDLEKELLRPSTEAARLNTAQVSQPATTAIQIALVALLQSFSIKPWAVVGHSSGEIAAAYTAGHLSARQALTLAYHRGFMADAAKAKGLGPGAMLSVGLGEADALPLTRELRRGIASIACVNSPSSVTISGDADAVDEVVSRLAATGSQNRSSHTFYRRLIVDTAYHSHHMQAVADDYRSSLAGLSWDEEARANRKGILFFSSVSGDVKSAGFGPEYWVDNLVSPVRFHDAMQTLARTDSGTQHTVFLEIGPHSALAGPVRQCLTNTERPKLSFDYYSVLQRHLDALTSTLGTAGRLFERNVGVNLKAVSALSMNSSTGVVLPNMPSYIWDHSQKHHFESRISREYRMRREPYHDLLGVRSMDDTSIEPRWRHMIGLNTLPWLGHHLIDSQPVFPGSGYLCMVIEAVRQIHRERHAEHPLEIIALRDVSFLRGLVVPNIQGQRTEVQLSLTPQPDTLLAFDFRITAEWDGEWREHCRGTVEGKLATAEYGGEGMESAQLGRLALADPSDLLLEDTSVDTEELYRELRESGNTYGATFASIQSYILKADASSATATVRIPNTAAFMPAQHQQPHLIHPATLDTVLHTSLPMALQHLGRASIMPVHIQEILLCASPATPREPGSTLDVLTAMRSSRFHTAVSDISVTAHGEAVLSASGIELRSLASRSDRGVEDAGGSVHADALDSLVVVARPRATGQELLKWPLGIRLLTRRHDDAEQKWLVDLAGQLRERFGPVSQESLHARTTWPTANSDEQSTSQCFVVVEDPMKPILSDPDCFGAVVSLLKQPGRTIIWLSPDEPLPMHQITGVARTAHAELEMLRLTTLHVAPDLLYADHESICSRLLDVLARVLVSEGADQEREYRVNKAGTVLVPRLLPEYSLNRAVREDATALTGVASRRFLDDSRTFAILSGGDAAPTLHAPHATQSHVFQEIERRPLQLADNQVEFETEAFALSEDGLRASHHNTYAGIITRTGATVHGLAPGDRIVAVGERIGANRLVVPRTKAGRLPPGISPSLGSTMILHAIAASHALRQLARLPRKGNVLIHGALTAVGRATVAVARHLEAIVSVSAASSQEARRMVDELGVAVDRVVVIHRSRSPKNVSVRSVDIIVQAQEGQVPTQILGHLRPFGSVAVLGSQDSRPKKQEDHSRWDIPQNFTVFFCNVLELLRECPEVLDSDLVAQAAAALCYLPVTGFDYCVRPVKHMAKALRLIEAGTCATVAVTADADAVIPVAMCHETQASAWSTRGASYLVSGGLGDLGRRLLFLMARRGAKHLITLSRRSIGVEDHSRLQAELRNISKDCNLYCVTCDITDYDSLGQAAARINQLGIPPVRGVIQSAADLTLDSMTYEDFLLATCVKVQGTIALERTFESPHLDFFIMLSSAVNILGSSGQANYNAGNSVQDALAYARRGRRCRYMSLSPGWIEDAAFTVDLSRYLDHALSAADGEPRPTQAVIGFDAASLSTATTHNGTLHSPLFSHVRGPPPSTAAGQISVSSPTDPAPSFTQALASGDPSLAADIAAAAVAGQLARLISVDARRIDVHKTSVLDLGVDSLISIELRNWVMREFDATLQSSEILMEQTMHGLAERIVARTALAAAASPSTGLESTQDTDEKRSFVTTLSGTTSPSTNLPRPSLQDLLSSFAASRAAVDSPEEQAITNDAIRQLINEHGESIQRALHDTPENLLDEAYERQIYLARREPLQDYSTFYLAHPVATTPHTQVDRATLLTTAATSFARRLALGELPPDELHGAPLDPEARRWLFHATRRPGLEVDHMERHPPSYSIVVLRRGHAFQMTLPGVEEALQPSAVRAAYEAIIDASNEPTPAVGALTADDRPSWARARAQLELDSTRADALAAIDRCAFVVCLDDEAPSTSGERHMQFLLNGPKAHLSNRWLDKPLQLVVAANGCSAGVYEHSKLDGMDARLLHHHLTESVLAHQTHEEVQPDLAGPEPQPAHCQVRELAWTPTDQTLLQQIDRIRLRGPSSYGTVDHRSVEIEAMGFERLRTHRAAPNATAHLAALLAVRIVDSCDGSREVLRPAWEIVSLAPFSCGRIDWVQTVTPAVRAFLEAA